MNMCTVREIREAIQEDCRSQRDMFDKPPMPKRPYRRKKKDTDRP